VDMLYLNVSKEFIKIKDILIPYRKLAKKEKIR
jgi:hypothetical protein